MFFGWFGTVIGENQARHLQRAGRPLVPHGDDVVHLLRGDVLRRVLRRAVLRAPAVGAVAGRRRRRRSSPTCSCGRTSSAPGRPTARRSRSAATALRDHSGARACRRSNTAILLTSGVTITIAHHALRAGNRGIAEDLPGARRSCSASLFVYLQAHEYIHAYTELGPDSSARGIYGSTFFMLTGFHGLHVTSAPSC